MGAEPKGVQLKRTLGYRKPPGAIVVSRPSRWSNPYRVGHDGVSDAVGVDGFFGEMALIDGGTRSATAIAKTDCKLVPITEKQFLFMVQETPFFALRVMRTLTARLRQVDRRLMQSEVPAPNS
jgi:signal-transduction protein with cAMP-binding, CBS, and nucleotidyltransferase domain